MHLLPSSTSRSDNKGNEPENGAFSADLGLAFIASERSSVIAVYDVKNKNKDPVFHQVLPTGVAPEGIIYLPNKEMLVVACELDARDDKIRSSVVLYEYGADDPSYPTIKSQDVSGVPIPFGALSGLSAPATGSLKKLYSLDDSFYKSNRIFEIDVSSKPAGKHFSVYGTELLLSRECACMKLANFVLNHN